MSFALSNCCHNGLTDYLIPLWRKMGIGGAPLIIIPLVTHGTVRHQLRQEDTSGTGTKFPCQLDRLLTVTIQSGIGLNDVARHEGKE